MPHFVIVKKPLQKYRIYLILVNQFSRRKQWFALIKVKVRPS